MARTPQPGTAAIAEGPPKFARQAPEPPDWLSAEARAEWDRVVPGLEALDLLKESDRAVLVAYCETWATYCETLSAVRENGYTVTNYSTRKDGSSSEWVTKNPAAAQLRSLAAEFGLTPASESNVSPSVSTDDPTNDPYAG